MTENKPISAVDAVPLHRITITRTRYGANGPRYRVNYHGETLIEGSRDPEHDAARALLAKGTTGLVETHFEDAVAPSFRLDIEAAAGRTVQEGRATGIRLGKWSPHHMAGAGDGEE